MREDQGSSQGNSSAVGGASLGSNLAALLARVEAADGRDVALDGAVHRALFPGERALIDPGDMRSGHPGVYGTIADLSYLGDRDLADYLGVSAYTASLDAALALCERVLPEAGWLCGVTADQYMAELFRTRFVSGVVPRLGYAAAPTPALALIAAMLKALIAQSKDGTAERPAMPRDDQP